MLGIYETLAAEPPGHTTPEGEGAVMHLPFSSPHLRPFPNLLESFGWVSQNKPDS